MINELYWALEAAAVALEDNARVCDNPKKADEYQVQANLIWEMFLSATEGDNPLERITSLRDREGICWDMAKRRMREKDADALYRDVNEIQKIQWAIRELEALL
jgi:hypothetical protein